MTNTTQSRRTKRHTSLGTPCSPAWDSDWIAVVETRERETGHRICGARTLAGTPCPLKSNHANGRCKYHGGFDLTGAQPGNRNAVIHGLYARGLARCGRQCPLWETCPCAGEDVTELPAKERPVCPYEKTLYDAAVTDTLPRMPRVIRGEPHPFYRHLAHQLALLQVMMTRAGAALAQSELVETTTASGDKYSMESSKPSAYLQAFLRISSEYRRYVKLAETEEGQELDDEDFAEHSRRGRHDTSQEPEHQAELARTVPLADTAAREVLEETKSKDFSDYPYTARKLLNRAIALAPHVVEPEREALDAEIAQGLVEFKKARGG